MSNDFKRGRVHKFDYVVGKARDEAAAESLRLRTQEALNSANLPQKALVTKIANGQGTYGWRVNVCSVVVK